MKKIKAQIDKYRSLLYEFGIATAKNELLLRIIGKIYGVDSEIWKKQSRKKYHLINDILKNEFSDIINKYQKYDNNDKITDLTPIWIYWAQGIENAPAVVKHCVKSIKDHSVQHPVILLDDRNITKVVNINANIMRLYKEGIISRVHFSDILRYKLLGDRGGIWCDSTLFFSKNIDKNLKKYQFYTIKHEMGKEYLACRGLWTGFFIATEKNNVMAEFVTECFEKYWEKHKYLIDYLLIDCIMYVGYENIMSIQNMINSIPKNNQNVFELMYSFDRLESLENLMKKVKESNIHKLTYKVAKGEKECVLIEKFFALYKENRWII